MGWLITIAEFFSGLYQLAKSFMGWETHHEEQKQAQEDAHAPVTKSEEHDWFEHRS